MKNSKSKGKEEEAVEKPNVKSDFPPLDEFTDELCSWKSLLRKFVESSKMKEIYNFVKAEYASKTIFPPQNLIFNAYKLTPISKIKVVVVGQDPYFNPGQAMGLSFSVPKGITPPPSLKNIYKCISEDPAIPSFTIPKHGDLTKWAQQGVFLLNAVLTVQSGKADSHKASGWAKFTDEVIKVLNEELDDLVFLLWGKPAQAKAKIVSRAKHCVIETSHPSPMSARNGFLTSQCFSKANEHLKKVGKTEIDWNLD